MKPIIAFLCLFTALFAEEYGPYEVYRGVQGNSFELNIKNNENSLGIIENFEVKELSRPVFIKNIYTDSKKNISMNKTGSFTVSFDCTNDLEFCGLDGVLKLELTSENDKIRELKNGNETNFSNEVSVQLKLVDLFSVTCNPPSAKIKKGKTSTFTLNVKNYDNFHDRTFMITLDEESNNWAVTKISPNWFDVSIEKGSNKDFEFSVENINAKPGSKFNLNVEVTELMTGITKRSDLLISAKVKGHSSDHPDDNYSVTSTEYPGEWLYDSKSAIGILSSGWGEGLHYLLGKFKIPTTVVKEDLTILNEPGKLLTDLKVLMIGSAGLDVLESSPTIRKGIEDFVSNGGQLIVLTAKTGSEYPALPGGEVRGYGWEEDQSCFNNAVSMVKYHQVLAGQDSTNITANFDGYFTQWPENSDVLLQRNKNSMPALISYKHGEGTVFAMTSFQDWAYGNNQSTVPGQKLIRDIVNWFLKGSNLPEFMKDSLITFDISIPNVSEIHSSIVVIRTLNPNRELVKIDTVNASIPVGDTFVYHYELEGKDSLGIWRVEYELLDSSGSIIRNDKCYDLFVVSNPSNVAKVNDLTLSITSNSEKYARGSDATFTFTARNNTDSIKSMEIWWSFPRNAHIKDDSIYGLPGQIRCGKQSTLTKTLTLQPHRDSVFQYTVPVHTWDRLWTQFYDENNDSLGILSRGFYTFIPTCNTSIELQESQLKKGDTLSFNVWSRGADDISDGEFHVSVLDPTNTKVWDTTYTNSFDVTKQYKDSFSYELPLDAATGSYVVVCEVVSDNEKVGSSNAPFYVERTSVLADLVMPSGLKEGNNTISIITKNLSRNQIDNGKILYKLISPAKNEIFSDSIPFTVDSEEQKYHDVSITIENIMIGDYILEIYVEHSGLTEKRVVKLLRNDVDIVLNNLKKNYAASENISLEYLINNTGCFDLSGQLSTSIIFGEVKNVDSDIQSISRNSVREVHKLTIPVINTIPGIKEGIVKFSLPSGDVVEEKLALVIRDPNVIVKTPSKELITGSPFQFELENVGGIATDVYYKSVLLDNNNTEVVSTEDNVSISALERKIASFVVPDYCAKGQYKIVSKVKIPSKVDTTTFVNFVYLENSLSAGIVVNTDKKMYSPLASTVNQSTNISLPELTSLTGEIKYEISRVNDISYEFDKSKWDTLGFGSRIQSLSSNSSHLTYGVTVGGRLLQWGYTGTDYYVDNNISGIEKCVTRDTEIMVLYRDSTVGRVGYAYNSDGKDSIPVGLSGVIDITFTDKQAFAVKADGSVVEWGNTPIGLDSLQNVLSIDANYSHIGILKKDGSIAEFGDFWYDEANGCPTDLNDVVQIVVASRYGLALRENGAIVGWGIQDHKTITDLPSHITDFTKIDGNTDFAFGLREDGTLVGWGDNRGGILDIPNDLDSIVDFCLGINHICVLLANGTTRSWGEDEYDLNLHRNPKVLTGVKKIDCAPFSIVALNENGSVEGWGAEYPNITMLPETLSNFVDVSIGTSFSAVLKSDSTIETFGYFPAEIPIPVDVKNIVSISTGPNNLLAIDKDSSLYVWGLNGDGQCDIPTVVQEGKVIAVANGMYHTVAVLSDGSVYAWGSNPYGQTDIPAGLSDVIAVNAGSYHTLAITKDGAVHAWGGNDYGQCDVPPSLSNVIAVEAVNGQSYAVKSDGTVVAWGEDYSGLLDVPEGLSDVVEISAGYENVFVRTKDGLVIGWGEDYEDVLNVINIPSNLYFTHDAGFNVPWKSVTIEDNNLHEYKVLSRVANDKDLLMKAEWDSTTQVGSDYLITSPNSRFIEFKVLGGEEITSNLEKISIQYLGRESVWDSTISNTFTSNEILSSTISSLNDTGQYVISAKLENSFDQDVAVDEKIFLISNLEVAVSFTTDKKAYRAGDTITVNASVINNSTTNISENVRFTAKGVEVYNDVVSVSSDGTTEITFKFESLNETFILSGSVLQFTGEDLITIAEPEISVSYEIPDTVGLKPFDAIINMANNSLVGGVVNVLVDGKSQTVIVPPTGKVTVSENIQKNDDGTVTVTLSGDKVDSYSHNVFVGEKGTITVNPSAVYPEGLISIPFEVENTGVLPLEIDITFTTGDKEFIKEIIVPVGNTLSNSISLNLESGEYQVSYSSQIGSGSIDYRVASENQLDVELHISSPKKANVLVLRDDATSYMLEDIADELGINVVLSDVPYYQWDGTTPSPDDFDAVILPVENYLGEIMDSSGQQTLVEYVKSGGGFFTGEYISMGYKHEGNFQLLDSILLNDLVATKDTGGLQEFYVVKEHPITKNLPDTININSGFGGTKGPLKDPKHLVISGSTLPNSIAAAQIGKGRVVQVGIQFDAFLYKCYTDSIMGILLANTLDWVTKTNETDSVLAKVVMTNTGYKDLYGNLQVKSDMFVAEDEISLGVNEILTLNYAIDVSNVSPGTYNFEALIKNGQAPISIVSDSFDVTGPEFKVSSIPENIVASPGDTLEIITGIENTGTGEGLVSVIVVMSDFLDLNQDVWIAPGIENNLSWRVIVPDDFPDGEYKGTIVLNDTMTVEFPFTVNGINVDVAYNLDKPMYALGDSLELTLDITNNGSFYPDVYALVTSNDHTTKEEFTLSTSNQVKLKLPVDEFTGKRLTFGLYQSSGRAIYINTAYIRIAEGAVNIYTEKDVYSVGETVKAYILTDEVGDIAISTSTGYEELISISGNDSFSFVLPTEAVSGTESIDFTISEHSGSCYFDVKGYILRVTDLSLNKNTYDPIDTMSVKLSINSNTAMPVIVKTWTYSSTGDYVELFEVLEELDSGLTSLSISSNFSTTTGGVQKLIYGVYKADNTLELLAGSQAFDVREAAVISALPQKKAFGDNEDAIISVNTFACSNFIGDIAVTDNSGATIYSQSVNLDGPGALSLNVGTLERNRHELHVSLLKEEELISTKSLIVKVQDLTAPAAPTGVTVGFNGVTPTVSWNENIESDIEGYNIYKNGKPFNVLLVPDTSFIGVNCIQGVEHIFTVTAVDSASNESVQSAAAKVIIDNIPPVLTITPDRDTVANAPVELTYSVTDNLDTNVTIIANYASPTLFDIDGEYDISVKALDKQGNSTSKAFSLSLETGAPHAVTELVAVDKEIGGTIELNWGSYQAPLDIGSFNIYVDTTDFQTVSGKVAYETVTSDITSLVINGLTNSKVYYFAVAPIDTKGNQNDVVSTASQVATGGTGFISVTSTPDSAEVYLGGSIGYMGAFKGVTPLVIDSIAERNVAIQLISKGHSRHYTDVTVTAFDTAVVDDTLSTRTFGTLSEGIVLKDVTGEINLGAAVSVNTIDWDNDSKLDLICGTQNGEILFYKNISVSDSVYFDNPDTLLRTSRTSISAFVADWNNDSRNDIIVGDENGYVYTYLATDSGFITSGESSIQVSGFGTPSVVDWNKNGKKDLLMGDGLGNILLFSNQGSDKEPVYSIMNVDTVFKTGLSQVAPLTVSDWNSDGKRDVIVGDAAGGVSVLINNGTDMNPVFDSLIQVCATANYAKPCMVDFNNDDMEDIIVGNGSGQAVLYKGMVADTSKTFITIFEEDFESGWNGWFHYNDYTSNTYYWDYAISGQSEVYVMEEGTGNNAMVTYLSNYGLETWHVHAGKSGLSMTNGKTYRVTLKARTEAGKERKIGVYVSGDASTGYLEYGSKVHTIDGELKSFSFEFVMNEATDIQSGIFVDMGNFQDGNGVWDVVIDDIEIEEMVE